MTPDEIAKRDAAIQALVDDGMDLGTAASQVDATMKFNVGDTEKTDAPWDLGNLGKAGLASKGLSVIGDIGSLVTAGKRQETTVNDLNDLADKTGTSVDVDDSAVKLAELNARGDTDANASTLATLLKSGLDPSAAQQIVSTQQKGQTSELLNQLNLHGGKQQTADEAAAARRAPIDAAATQAGMPIDYFAAGSDIASTAGDLLLGGEALKNPTPTTARSGRKLTYEDGGKSPDVKDLLDILNRSDRPRAMHDLTKSFSDLGFDSSEDAVSALSKIKSSMNTTEWRDGGGLQTTQGPSDHSENPMLITNPDGSPATDDQGYQIEVTGKETIIPDWLMAQLMEAARKGPKELSKVFKDEISDEERFNQA